jgi:hypothetical protein
MPGRPAAQPIQAATGQPYGQAGEQMAAQRVVPMADTRPETPTTSPPPAPAAVPRAPLPRLDAPSQRPNEPVTALPQTNPVDPAMIQLVLKMAAQPNAPKPIRDLAQRLVTMFGGV